ncbi:acyltransferase [Bosea sp. (in: a-proteobacteria)]|uniref:acyltransferase family protein n=1 Tax=Bosea sp. (in: a-proteobacteria) TaxID=1871050 RepID=UPI00260965CA|nr:acyltransferase [Bosea sp. (in: a-proteobacteria)]MCO5093176.1 acyltransferase [Bosea sp. (in: a-proteobacteria)]
MKKLYSVQYLRACAALLVLFAHAFSYQIGTDDPIIVAAGRLGVVLFFVISGFIMVYISGQGPFPASTFLKRRAIRIVPLYWLFTSLTALLAALAPSLFQTTAFTWPHYLQSLFFIVHEAPGRDSTSPLLSLGWTLNYEIYFYIAFALLAFLSVGSRVRVLTLVFGAMWLTGLLLAPANPVLQFYLNASPLAFVIGSWIGRRYLDRGFACGTRDLWLLGLLALGGAALALVDDGTPLMSQISFAGQALWGAGLLLCGLGLEPRLKRWSLLEQLGDASYALYLSHIFVIGAVAHLAKRTIGYDQPATVLLVSVVSMVAACIASLAIHRVIEKPILRALSGRRKPRNTPLPDDVVEVK